ncbi:GNAT family N-acetyltransferase [Streptomyces sp. NPDC031705]|uniref:GNAT family N-acetyltransferase n=1 Tax=Streptomyces sp. NPDC031705 TaxID=3155729 RepID=UPI003401BD87
MEHCVTIELKRYGHDDLGDIRRTLLDMHEDAYADRRHEEFVQRFPWFVDHWGGKPGFSCVIAWEGPVAVGFSYGAPATPGREWWQGHLDTPPERPDTHDALLEGRPEALAVLTVDTKRPRLQAMYEGWGYRKIGENQPFADSPVYAVMLTGLTGR